MTTDGASPDDPSIGTGTWCCALDLAGDRTPDAPLPLGEQRLARVLVRIHGEPLGYVSVPVGPEGLDVAAVVTRAEERFGAALREHLRAEGLPAPDATELPPLPGPTAACPNRVESDALVSVVVCTRNRSEILAACLDRLRALSYPHLDVVVVDNAPSDDSTERLVAAVAAEDARFRYVREPRPGLSRARNRGLAEARGRYLAYTDDDVAVDADWIQGLLRGFARAGDVACVTGLVATAGITGPAEEYFDARAAAWSTRCEPALHRPDDGGGDPLYPYRPSSFGTGANFAFDREFVVGLGGFDEALGAGTRTRGGEDLDIFVRVLRAGRSIAYEPAAIVWHHHRADHAALLEQMYGYGTGLTAFVAKCLLQRGTRGEVLRRVPAGLRRLAGIRADTAERLATAGDDAGRQAADRPSGAMARELLGLVAGPVLYVRARAEVNRAANAG